MRLTEGSRPALAAREDERYPGAIHKDGGETYARLLMTGDQRRAVYAHQINGKTVGLKEIVEKEEGQFSTIYHHTTVHTVTQKYLSIASRWKRGTAKALNLVVGYHPITEGEIVR